LDKPMIISNDPAADKATRAYPMMSYKFPGWPSPYKYCQLLIKFGVDCELYTYQNGDTTVSGTSEDPISAIDLGDIRFGLEARLEGNNAAIRSVTVTQENRLFRPSESSETSSISQRIVQIDPITGEGSMKLVTVQQATYGVATSNGQLLYYVPQSADVFDEAINYTLSDQEGRFQERTFEIPPPAVSAKPPIMLPLIMNK